MIGLQGFCFYVDFLSLSVLGLKSGELGGFSIGVSMYAVSCVGDIERVPTVIHV